MINTIGRAIKKCTNAFVILTVVVAGTGCGHYFENKVVNNETQAQEQEVPTIDESIPWSALHIMTDFAVTNEGYYFICNSSNGKYISYYDIASDTYGRWCSRADCNHTDVSICTSMFAEDMYTRWIQVSGDYLYMLRMGEDGSYLMRRNLDGSNLTEIAKLWNTNAIFSDWTDSASPNHPGQIHIHSGYVYYIVTEDSRNVSLCRTALDGSVLQEVVYNWVSSGVSDMGMMECDSESIYLYRSLHTDNALMIRYYPKTGEIKEVYKKVDGVAQGIFAESTNYKMDSFNIYEGGKICFSSYGQSYIYDVNAGTITEASYGKGGTLTYDGKYMISKVQFKQSVFKVVNSKGEEIVTFDLKDYLGEDVYEHMYIKYDDSRYIFWWDSIKGYYAMDRTALEKGEVKIKQVVERD